MIIKPISVSSFGYQFSINYIIFFFLGRIEAYIPKEFEKSILTYQKYLNCRCKVTYYTILLYYPNIKFNYVRKLFEKYKLYKSLVADTMQFT